MLVGFAAPALADAPFSGEQVIVSGLSGVNNVAAAPIDGATGADIFHAIEGAQTLGIQFQSAGPTWTPLALTPNSRSRSITTADLDGDGDNDLLYGDYNGSQVYWRENDLDGTGVFLARVSLASSGSVQGVDAADIDGDNDLDVIFAARTGDAYYWVENVNGDASSWTRHTIATSVNAAQVVVAADLDGDGDLDVAGGSSSGSGKLAWYENVNGDGTSWLGRDIYSSRIGAVAAGDLDLDGDVDLLVQDIVADDILWWENTAGDGTAWTSTMISSFAASRKGLQARDLDFDGDLDVVGDPNGDWWENIDKGTSWTRRSYSGGSDITDTEVVDMDEDGDLDIVAARNSANQVSWWENLTCSPGDSDDDSDGVRNDCDVCDGFDDTVDSDGDLVPDGCDVCPGFDDRVDNDGDMVPDACAAAASVSIDNVTTAEGNSGTTTFTFTVTLNGTVAGGFTLPYSTSDGTATTSGGDYAAASGTLTFSGTDGEQQSLDVPVSGDTRLEDSETFSVNLGSPASGSVTVDDGTGTGTIFNDDVVAMSIDDPVVMEGDSGTTNLVFTATVTGEAEGGFSINFVSGDNTATVADNDYVANTGTLNYVGNDGEQQTISIQINGDTKLEADERIFVQLRTPSRLGVTIPDGTGHGTIQNDDSATVSLNSVSQVETDAGTATFQLTATLTNDVAGGFTVPFSTSDGTATVADNDYAPASGTLTFGGIDGETQTVDVTVNGDTLVESDETFNLSLGMPSRPNIVTSNGAGTIQNDDSASISVDDVIQVETDGATTFSFTVTLLGGLPGGFTVPYSTSDGTATTADGDYTSASGTLTFVGTAGETQSFDVTVNGDAKVESDEAFTVSLGSPSSGLVTVTDGTGTGTVQNDDAATLAIDDVTLAEGDSGTTNFQFTVTLSDPVDGGVALSYSTVDGTATVAAGDYAAASGTLNFVGSGGETQIVDIAVNGDAVLESDETFTVRLGTSAVANVTVSDDSGLGTVQNDDSASIAIDDVSQAEGDAGTSAFTFTATLTGAVEAPFNVNYATADGSADNSDYAATSGTFNFAGTDSETQTVDVTVNGDMLLESDETFTVDLSGLSDSRVTLTDGSGLGTIQNDDSASLSIDDVTQVETDGATTFTFTVTFTGNVAGGFTVTALTNAVTAAAGIDFSPVATILNFAGTDGETQTVDVTVNGDALLESDETFTVDLGIPSVAAITVADGSGLGTITNDDSASISIDDVAQVETSGGTTFQFTVTLNGGVSGGFTVPYSTTDGTATVADGDYTTAAGTLGFGGSDGETQTVNVTVNGDTVVEGDETFTVDLGTPSNIDITVADGSGLGTIQGDDTASISIDDVMGLETEGTAVFQFTVTLSGDVSGGFTVPFATSDGTATLADDDYAVASGTLTFSGSNGETQTVDVAVNGDAVVEGDEAFTVDLGTASIVSVIVVDGSGLGTIQGDDTASISIDNVTELETEAATLFQFMVTLSGDVSGGFDVPFVTLDGTATASDDYTATSGTLSFVGTDSETQTVDVTVNGDGVVEIDETFTVDLGTPSNTLVSVNDGSGLGTIQNDDDGALLSATLEVMSYDSPFDIVVYLVEITNVGTGEQLDDPLSDELENVLPSELRLLGATSDTPGFVVTFDTDTGAVYGNGTLAAGQSVAVLIEAVVTVEPGIEVSNQALVRYDIDHDSTNESSTLTDDPSTMDGDDSTVFVAQSVVAIPTLDQYGLAVMILALLIAAMRMGRKTKSA